MIRPPERVEPEGFDPVRDSEPSLPGETFLALEHQPDAHRPDLSGTPTAVGGPGIASRPRRLLQEDVPAITVENILTLPRIPEPDRSISSDRPVLAITTAPKGVEGEGF